MRIGHRVGSLRFRCLFPRPLNFPCFNRLESRGFICSERKCLSNNDDIEFLPWLRWKSGQEISSMLSIGWSTYGRSLFSSRCIHAGERILSVPYSVQLTPDGIPSLLKPLIADNVGDIGRLALVLLAERRSGQGSDWAPYVSRLPHVDDMHCLIFWSDNELEMIRPSLIYHEALHQRNCIEKEYLAVKPVLDHFSETLGHVSLKSFMHAYALDFLNHDGNSENALMSDEDHETSEVIAGRDYAAGEEVLIRYGKFSNATLLLDFGFTVRENMYDEISLVSLSSSAIGELGNCIRIQGRLCSLLNRPKDPRNDPRELKRKYIYVNILMDVPKDDPLYKSKMELLHKHCMQTTAHAITINSSSGYFTIKEVRSIHGNGKGIPPALRAFARVLSAKSLDDLEDMRAEASENDGRLARRPLRRVEREIGAHLILFSKISSMIESYDASLKWLEYLDNICDRGQRSCRIDMARDLLAGELRVLKSAYCWLEKYCSG